MQGRIEAYSETKVTFYVEGKLKSNIQQTFLQYANGAKDDEELSYKWDYVVTFHFDDDEKEQIRLPVNGICLIPRVRLSAGVLQYGTVSVGSRSSQTVVLSNNSDSSIVVNFPKSNNYDFKPARTKVSPLSELKVEVWFHPKKNGDLHEVYMVEVGVFRLPLKLFGVGKVTNSATPGIYFESGTTHRHNNLELSSICKSMMTQESSHYFDMSRMHISSICDKSVLGGKDETLRMIRKQRL